MPVTEIPRPPVRPRGGVSKVELIPAPEWAGVGSSSPPMAAWAFCEDRAHYSEELTGAHPRVPLVLHTLDATIAATPESRRAVRELRAVNGAGFVARVTLASGERVVVGSSARFGVEYPLRLAECSLASGHTPADLCALTLKFVSTDADSSETV